MVNDPFTFVAVFPARFAKGVEAALDLAEFVSQIASRGELGDQIGPAKLVQIRAFTLLVNGIFVGAALEHELVDNGP